MRMMTAAAILTSLGVLGLASPTPAQSAKEGPKEIRVFVLDKAGNPIDTRGWTGAIEVTPEHGTQRTYKLEQAAPGRGAGEHSKTESEERYSNAEGSRAAEPPAQDTPKQHHKEEGKSGMMMKEHPICGEARKLDDGWVEMVVVWPKSAQGKHEMPQGSAMERDGFMHDHGSAYFRAPVDAAALRDPKTNTVNFSARVVFTTPGGDTKYVKGYTYPAGLIDNGLGRLIDKDFYDTSKFDHEQAARVAHKVHAAIYALPPLSFKSDGDRQEYEKARQDCAAACKRLESATGKDIGDAADACKSALKEVRSQASDAQGAMLSE